MKKRILTKQQNNRRYKLHQEIKRSFRYSAKGKIVEVEAIQTGIIEPKVERALKELQDTFGYSLQFAIPQYKIGDKVRIHPLHEHPYERGKFYEIVGIAGKYATIQRYTGRWKRPFEKHISSLIPIKNG